MPQNVKYKKTSGAITGILVQKQTKSMQIYCVELCIARRYLAEGLEFTEKIPANTGTTIYPGKTYDNGLNINTPNQKI